MIATQNKNIVQGKIFSWENKSLQ